MKSRTLHSVSKVSKAGQPQTTCIEKAPATKGQCEIKRTGWPGKFGGTQQMIAPIAYVLFYYAIKLDPNRGQTEPKAVLTLAREEGTVVFY